MKWLVAYLVVGFFATMVWNVQVNHACGRPLSFTGLFLGPLMMPLLAPAIIWQDSKPECSKMASAFLPHDKVAP